MERESSELPIRATEPAPEIAQDEPLRLDDEGLENQPLLARFLGLPVLLKVQWMLVFLMVFSLPFETWRAGMEIEENRTGDSEEFVTFTRIAVLMLLATSFARFKFCIKSFLSPTIIVMGVAVACEFTFAVAQDVFFMPECSARIISRIQLLMMTACVAGIIREGAPVELVLIPFSFGCGLAAILTTTGVFSQFHVERVWYEYSYRMTLPGSDPNMSAGLLGVGVLFSSLAAGGFIKSPSVPRAAYAALSGITMLTVVQTGSRGAIVALLVAVCAFFVAVRGGKNAFIAKVAVAFVLLAGLTYGVSRTEFFEARLRRTFYGGDLAGRDFILSAATELFFARPFFGHGTGINTLELGKQVGLDQRDPHNVVAYQLTAVGIVGTLPWIAAMVLFALNGVRGRNGGWGPLALTLFPYAMTINMAITWHDRKAHWLVLAIALGAGELMRDRLRNRNEQ